jgi:hypothetical protein
MDDQTINERFAELRGDDARLAPEFQAAMSGRGGGDPHHAARLRKGRLAVVASLVVVTAFAATILTRRPLSTDSLAEWRPSSDILLTQARSGLLTSMQSISSSVFDTIIPKP